MQLLIIISSLLLLSTPLEAAARTSEYPYTFMTADAEEAAARKYDYIIVGGGTAGCPLAATLSHKYSVLVVERGGSPYGNSDIENADAYGKALRETNNYTSIAQGVISEDGVQLHRARVLGGGTAVNAGFYSRASKEYIQKVGWDEKLVKESYEWVEKQIAFEPKRLSTWSSSFKDALLEAGVVPYNGYTADHVEGTKIGASTFDNNGKRHTAADLLKHANPENIVVLLNATASRILFSSTSGKLKAGGVEFLSVVDGRLYEVSLNPFSGSSEVIVSAGSIGSPQLLLLSGIGPSQHLKQFNIPVLLNLPSVGKGVQDNPSAIMIIQSSRPLENSNIQVVGIINESQIYMESASSAQQLTSNNGTTGSQYLGGIFQKVAFPLSTGELQLRSRDPRDNPSVRYNYYSHPQDLQTCIQGVRVMAELTRTASIRQYTFANTSTATSDLRFVGQPLPENISDDTAVAKFCKDTLATIWHFHGGCHIGSVIDREYKVKGVNGLRIVDGSTFKDGSPGTNPQATTMMLGRYSGMKILQERLTKL